MIVRLYLEGEDSTCNNTTFAVLTHAYTMDLDISLGTTSGITVIGSATA